MNEIEVNIRTLKAAMEFILTLELRLGLMYLVYLVKLMRVNEIRDNIRPFGNIMKIETSNIS